MTGPESPSRRDIVTARYSGLARDALAGGDITDGDPGAAAEGCFGAAAYPAADGAPEAALRASHIEDIPLPDGHVDVVISNCVINLSTDKPGVLAEAFRVLRPGGRLGVSDVIAEEGAGPARLGAAERDIGCLNGALPQRQYLRLLQAAGFAEATVRLTHEAGPWLHAAIIQAVRPAGAGA